MSSLLRILLALLCLGLTSLAREYPVTSVRVVDGDTVHVNIDLGFNLYVNKPMRLQDVDALELKEPGGKEAKSFLISFLSGKSITLVTPQTKKTDKYGRIIGRLLANGVDAGQALKESGFAKFYGRKEATP